jgi:5-methylcytosine-specific restriction endonuclease McrA
LRKISEKGLTKKLDDIIREKVRERDGNCCVWCGKPVKGFDSQVSHVIPKSRSTFLRWDMMNVKLLCSFCHNEKWHRRALGRAWFDTKYPDRTAYLTANEHRLVNAKKFKEKLYNSLREYERTN